MQSCRMPQPLAQLALLLFTLLCQPPSALCSLASTYQVYQVIGPAASLPNVNSTPVIMMANSFPLSGGSASTGLAAWQATNLWVQVANARGGVVLNGQQHYFSFITIDDGSSAGYVLDIYEQYLAQITSGVLNTSILFASWGSGLTLPALGAILQSGLNLTFYAMGSSSPSIFVNGASYVYRYCYSSSVLASHQLDWPIESLLSQIEPPIRRVAIFYRPDSFATPVYQAFMAWVQAANITVISNVVISSVVSGAPYSAWAELLLTAIPAPSTPFDMLFLCSSSTSDMLSAAGGLAISQHRPGMALYPNSALDTDPTTIKTADQWVSLFGWNNDINYTVTVPNAAFTSTTQLVDLLAAEYNAAPIPAHMAAVASLDILLSAMIQAQSVKPEPLRTALLNVTGFTVYNYIKFDPNYQFDVNLRLLPYQLRAGSDHRINSPADLTYPAQWAWLSATQPGAELSVSSDLSLVVLAVVLSVFGSWIALLLVEQLLVYRRSANVRGYFTWLILVAVAVGAGSTWTSLLTLFASLSIPCALCTQSTSLSYSAAAILLALLPAVLLTVVGHWLLSTQNRVGRASGKLESTGRSLTIETSALSATSAGAVELLQASKEPQRKPPAALRSLALDTREQVARLVRLVRLPFMVGAVCVTAAIVLTRVTLTFSLVGLVTWTSSPLANFFSTLVCLALTLLSMLAYYYATRFRLLGVLLFSLAVHVDFQFQLALANIQYEPYEASMLPASFNAVTLSSAVLIGTAAIVGGVLGLLFIYLQFSVMKLSNHEIARTVSQMKKKQHHTDTLLEAELNTSKLHLLYAAAANQALEATNLLRPLVSAESNAYSAVIAPLWLQVSGVAYEQSHLFKSAHEVDQLLKALPRESQGALSAEKEVLEGIAQWTADRAEKSFLHLLRGGADVSDGVAELCATSQLTTAQFRHLRSNLRASHFLSHPFTCEVLKDELTRQMCVENVVFLLHVKKWKSESAHSARQKELAAHLIRQFVRDGAPFQVNINATLRSKIEQAYAKGSVDARLFIAAESEALSLIETNNMKHFRSSPLYSACVHMLGHNWRAIQAHGQQTPQVEEAAESTQINNTGSKEARSSLSQPDGSTLSADRTRGSLSELSSDAAVADSSQPRPSGNSRVWGLSATTMAPGGDRQKTSTVQAQGAPGWVAKDEDEEDL